MKKKVVFVVFRLIHPRVARSLLTNMSPLIQGDWIPVENRGSTNLTQRAKFSLLDDRLILLGLKHFGEKNIDAIQHYYLKGKKSKEVQYRYKNLICSRASNNDIKRWKGLSVAPLSLEEQKRLKCGQKWYGDKLKLITKNFLYNRTSEFLEK